MTIGRVRERWGRGETAIALGLDFPTPSFAEFAGHLGFDAVVVDLEHGHCDESTIEDICRAGGLTGMDVLVRTPPDAATVDRCLDVGVTGFQLTHVEDVGEVERVIRQTRFVPDGTRGIGRSRSSRFGHFPGGYPALIEERTRPLLVIHVESRTGVDALPDLLAIEDVDVVFVGAYDLSADLGLPGRLDDERVVRALEQVRRAISGSDRRLGLSASEEDTARTGLSEGARYLLASQARLVSGSASPLIRRAREFGGLRDDD